KMNKTRATILVSQSINLSVTGQESGVKWSSSDKKVAKVSSTGKVTGKKPGKATIKAKVGSKTYKCKVTVKIGLSKTRVTLSAGESTKIKLCGSKIKKVKTSDKKVATINKKGIITAVGAGEATITITGKNKKKGNKSGEMSNLEKTVENSVETAHIGSGC
ncbi:Ig-like domain-containing protein, partial [Candidatus Saccharibacteria bacterium]|nr:Ig-like domain-containing protein [Candidatus Saccharibacteria bacterium]